MNYSPIFRLAALFVAAGILAMLASPATAAFFYSPQLGSGSGGIPFNDRFGHRAGEKVKKIEIRGGDLVDQVTFITQYRTLRHGGSGGVLQSLELKGDERITRFAACMGTGHGVSWVRFVTSAGRAVEGGFRTVGCHATDFPKCMRVVGMLGRSGHRVDELGIVVDADRI